MKQKLVKELAFTLLCQLKTNRLMRELKSLIFLFQRIEKIEKYLK